MKICPYCDEENEYDADYCEYCNEYIEDVEDEDDFAQKSDGFSGIAWFVIAFLVAFFVSASITSNQKSEDELDYDYYFDIGCDDAYHGKSPQYPDDSYYMDGYNECR